MAPEANNETHFALFPFVAPGHMIPMMDIARALARRGLVVTVFMTHKNADRFGKGLDPAGRIRLARMSFPSSEVGLPEGLESFDMVPDRSTAMKFFKGVAMLQLQAEELFRQLRPRPCCLISDKFLVWTLDIANKFHVPRITFSGFGCFFLACVGKLLDSDVMDAVGSDSEYFVVPGLPDRVEFTKDQMSIAQSMRDTPGASLRAVAVADKASYGVIVNSFEELEPAYAEEYKKSRGGKAWCIGPVALRPEPIREHECFEWLDSWPRGSVVYACMGSTYNVSPAQMMELGLGLEASDKPFVWAAKAGEAMQRLIDENGFEERVKGKGLLIKGWAPQVGILSHPAVGAFLTHCGWNSTLEGVSAGLPLITWPVFGDQFANHKFAEQVLNIGVGVGAETPVNFGEEEKMGVLVKREDVERAVREVMDEGKEGEERRRKARELGESAKRAMEEGGSSQNNLLMLIQDVMQQANNRI